MKCARKKPQMKRGLSPRPVSKTSQQKTPSCTICGQPATANPDPDSHVTEIDDKSHRQPYLWLFVSSKMMENAQSAHRFQVTKVEEGSIQNPEPLNESDAHQTVQTSDVDKADEAPVKFSIGDDAEGADAFTFGKNTLDAIPHVDHYRNHHSACMPLKVRPSLADLHEAKDDRDIQTFQTETPPEEKSTKDKAVKFGWIKGVLIRCLLNIWGVMLFLRLSWVTGQAGVALGSLVVLLSVLVTVVTALSMSAICTNGIVKGGGAYYMISRSIGPDFGGAIGVIFAIANAVAVSMYVVGFSETVRDLLKEHDAIIIDEQNDIRLIGCITVTLLLAIALIGMEWETRAQIILLGILLVAIANFIVGSCLSPTETKMAQGYTGYRGDVLAENLQPDFRDGHDFFSVFSIFFPAATGILAGANISGDLKNPQVDIPKGTFLAILITGVLYVGTVWMLGACNLREATGPLAYQILTGRGFGNFTTAQSVLNSSVSIQPDLTLANIQNCTLGEEGVCKFGLLHDYQLMEMVSGFGPLVTAGIFSATLSSALASLVSAPKVFQAVAKDKLFPKVKFFAKGYGASENPRRAYILAYVIGVGFILIGDLNAIAPIISNFFLMAYMLINYSCFDNSLSKSPGWRPSFKYYNMWVSLLGALLCLAVMFIINWWAALVTFACIAAIFVYVHHRKPDVNWGSSTQAHVYRSALNNTIKLLHTEDHVKTFRPQVLVLTGFPCNRPELVYFVNSLTKKIGLMVCGHIIEGSHSETLKEFCNYKSGNVNTWLRQRKIKGFYNVTTAKCFREGARSLMQNAGIGKLRPNILIMGFKSTWKTDKPENMDAYFSVIHDAFDYDFGMGILRMPSRMYQEQADVVIDIDEVAHNGIQLGNNNSLTTSCDSGLDTDTPTRRYTSESPDSHIKATASPTITNIDDNLIFAKKQKGTIDVWWLYDDGGLTLLVPYILQTKKKWKNCGLRVFTAGTKRGELVREQKQMAQLLSKFRIHCEDMKIISDIGTPPTEKSQLAFAERLQGLILDEENGETAEEYPWKTTKHELVLLKEKTNRQMRLNELLHEHSSGASLIVMTLPVLRKGTCSSSLYMAWLETLTQDMPPILLPRENQQSVLTFYS